MRTLAFVLFAMTVFACSTASAPEQQSGASSAISGDNACIEACDTTFPDAAFFAQDERACIEYCKSDQDCAQNCKDQHDEACSRAHGQCEDYADCTGTCR